jgi:hypothetical protein
MVSEAQRTIKSALSDALTETEENTGASAQWLAII